MKAEVLNGPRPRSRLGEVSPGREDTMMIKCKENVGKPTIR